MAISSIPFLEHENDSAACSCSQMILNVPYIHSPKVNDCYGKPPNQLDASELPYWEVWFYQHRIRRDRLLGWS
jgi:hypothetical protein